jgi:hypothetical protein
MRLGLARTTGEQKRLFELSSDCGVPFEWIVEGRAEMRGVAQIRPLRFAERHAVTE